MTDETIKGTETESVGVGAGVAMDGNRPWGSAPVHGAMRGWQRHREAYEGWMEENGLGMFPLDELALLFANVGVKWDFIEDAVREEGVELFNVADDKVDTKPMDTHYHVEYAFLRTPDPSFRLELMTVESGFSPLHSALAFNSMLDRRPLGVHLSFKVEEHGEYVNLCEVLLANEQAELIQECRSSYGVFSYWKIERLWKSHAALYLKPRCNLRDREFGFPGVGVNVSGSWPVL